MRVDGRRRRLVAEVLVDLARLLGPAQEDRVRALGRAQRELVEREALAAGLDDPRARRLGEAQRADGELGHLEQARVVRDGAHQHGDLVLLALHELCQVVQRERRPVRPRHEQPLQDHLDELGVRPAAQEPVELHEELEVHVLRPRVGPRLVAHAPSACHNVYAHG